MTGAKFAELVREICGKSDQNFQVDNQEVLAAVEVVIASTLASYVRNKQDIPDGFYVPFIVKVKVDHLRQRKYCEPQKPRFVNLSENAGIKTIGPVADDRTAYIALRNGMLSVISDMEVGGLSGRTGFIVEGSRIWFENIDPTVTDVLVKMIPRVSEMDDEDEIFAGDEIEDAVLVSVVNRFMGAAQKMKDDKANDGKQD